MFNHLMYLDRNFYRTKEEIEQWIANDPIGRFENELQQLGLITAQDIAALVTSVRAEVEEAVEFARLSPAPAIADLTQFVYSNPQSEVSHVG